MEVLYFFIKYVQAQEIKNKLNKLLIVNKQI